MEKCGFKDTKEQTIGSKEQEGNFYIPEAKIRVEEISLNEKII